VSASTRLWRPHLACALLLIAQCVVWALLHRTEAELESAARVGDARSRIAALHVLANRGEPAPGRFGEEFVAALLEEEDDLLRDYAFTTDVAKHAEPRLQYGALKELATRPEDPAFWQAFVLHRRKIGVITGGSSARLKLQELEWYLDARAGRPLPGAELLRYVEAHP